MFSEEQQQILLNLARATVENEFIKKQIDGNLLDDPLFKQKLGAFVTIHKKKQLRGCIGSILAKSSLIETITTMAKKAAFHDPRFSQLKYAELEDITFEISILSPLSLVEDVSKISVGTHGLMLQMNGKSGVFLPQVPIEQEWNRIEYLDHLCLKAGLPISSWKKADLYQFTATVFSE